MKRCAFFMLLALFVMLTPAFAQDEQTYDLQPQFVEGQSARYGYWSQRVTQMTATAFDETQEASQTIRSEGEVIWTVERVEADGSARCRLVYQFIELTFTDNEGEQHVNDSRRGSGDIPEIHALLTAVIDSPITVHIGSDGRIERVEGLDTIRNQLDEPEIMPRDENFYETVVDLAFMPNAPAQAHVGDTWQSVFEGAHQFGDLVRNAQWTLTQVETLEGIPVATVDGTFSFDFTPDLGDIPEEAPEVNAQLVEAAGNMQVFYDLDRNEVVGRNANKTLRFQVSIPLGPSTLEQDIIEQGQFQLWREAEEE